MQKRQIIDDWASVKNNENRYFFFFYNSFQSKQLKAIERQEVSFLLPICINGTVLQINFDIDFIKFM